MKNEKKATKRLEKEFKKIKEEIQEKAEFYPDKSTTESYSWMFKIEDSNIIYTYFYENEKLEKRFG